MNELSSEEKFWRIVEDCLVELHGLPRAEAVARWQDLLRRLREHPDGDVEEITYHDEPLYVADALAGRDLDDHAVGPQYRAIQARYWPQVRPDTSALRPA